MLSVLLFSGLYPAMRASSELGVRQNTQSPNFPGLLARKIPRVAALNRALLSEEHPGNRCDRGPSVVLGLRVLESLGFGLGFRVMKL